MIVIVGAGPAGLSLAYYLQKSGQTFRILEQFEVGSSWGRMYDHVRLHSLKQHSALPGLAMPEDYPDFPSGQQVYDYLRAYAQHFGFDVLPQTKVVSVTYQGVWKLETSGGIMEASQLIVATGIYNTPFIPALRGLASFPGKVLHSQAYKRPQDFAGQRVLVVGVGNSGAEIALALTTAGIQTDVVVREGVLFVPYPRSASLSALRYWGLRVLPVGLVNRFLGAFQRGFDPLGLPLPHKRPLERYPVVGLEFPELVAKGQLTVQPQISHIEGHMVYFKAGQEKSYDAIILATGFRPNIDFVPEQLQDYPKLYKLGFCYPTTEPFLWAIKREAKLLSHRLVQDQVASAR